MNEAALDVRQYFAEFGIRMAGIALDLVVLLIIIAQLLLPAIPSISGSPIDNMPTLLVLFSVYFAAFWVSPLKATPVQFLFGMRVVDVNGRRLTVLRAWLRAVVLSGIIGATILFFRAPGDPWQLVGIIGLALLVPAIVSPNRQAVHDLFGKSIVVNRSALSSEKQRAALLQHVADPESATRPKRRPSIPRVIFDLLVLVIPVYMIWAATLIALDRNIYARVAYAMDNVSSLKWAVETHYLASGEWPKRDDDVGAPIWQRYPDGGYYELGENGVIRIHFEVKRQLKGGALVLRPEADGDEIEWQCVVDGYIARKHLPRGCRS